MNFRQQAVFLFTGTAVSCALAGATLSNNRAKISLDDRGRIVSIQSLDTGRELEAKPGTEFFAYAISTNGAWFVPQTVEQKDTTLTFHFPNGNLVLGVETKPDYFIFTVQSQTLPDVRDLVFAQVSRLTCNAYCGHMASMYSDDSDAVFLHGLDLPVDMECNSSRVYVWTTRKNGLTGSRAALAVAAKAKIVSVLRQITLDTQQPHTLCGGAWSEGAELNRGSYLFADLTHDSTDNWIDLLQRMGYKDLHIHGWWKTLGSYEPNGHFPNGLADMKDSVDRVRAAGLHVGFHTLSCGISPEDPWVKGDDVTDLKGWCTYTLAKDLGKKDEALFVNEPLAKNHDLVFTYDSNGTAIRIGTEVILYDALLKDKPYGFKILKRGAFGTKIAAHKAGEEAVYLQQRYWEFYPKYDSPLADKLAKRIGYIDKYLDLDEIYFDGSEGMMNRFEIDIMMRKIFAELKPNTQCEASGWYQQAWWYHSRIGAWDNDKWAPKRFQDRHVAQMALSRKAELLAPQMGWWAPKLTSGFCRGHFLDEIEYFACKNLSMDAASSMQDINVSGDFLPFGIERQMTLLGQYERLRLAHYFDKSTLERVGELGKEFKLEQEESGEWHFRPMAVTSHRMTTASKQPLSWTLSRTGKDQPANVRIEALYSVEPYLSSNRMAFVKAGDSFAPAETAKGVKLTVSQKTEDGFNAVVLSAENPGAESKGAWGRITHLFAPCYDLGKNNAFGMWVKGDGSGALFAMTIASPREYGAGISIHIVKLDFTGWRYVEFLLRERDVEEMDKYEWPFKYATGDLFRTAIYQDKVSEVRFYLNEIPAKGKATVAFSEVYTLPLIPLPFRDIVLTVNDTALSIPFPMQSGDYLELDASSVKRYSARGDLESEALLTSLLHGSAAPLFKGAKTMLAFSATTGRTELSTRVEATAFEYGEPFAGRNTDADKKEMAREYDMPVMLAEAVPNGVSFPVIVRKDATAKLDFDIIGPMAGLKISCGGKTIALPAVASRTRLCIRGGKNWTLRNPNGSVASAGVLNEALEPLKGGKNILTISCTSCTEKGVHGRISWVKLYE